VSKKIVHEIDKISKIQKGVSKMKIEQKMPNFNIREDWTLFRSLSTLVQKAGVPREEITKLVIKELVDNALDNCGSCKIGKLSNGAFFIEDHGDGIQGSDEDIAFLFSIKRPLMTSKLIRLPSRGALGNGLRVVTGAVLSTGGSLRISTNGRTLRLLPMNEGRTDHIKEGEFAWKGTRIEIILLNIDTNNALVWGKQAILISQGKESTSYKGKTSAFFYDSESFFELLNSTNSSRTVRDFIQQFDGCSGQKASTIAATYLDKKANQLTFVESEELLFKARQLSTPVKPLRLGQVGMLEGFSGYARKYHTIMIKSNKGKHNADIPSVVEIWAKAGQRKSSIDFYVNRTPIVNEISYYQEKSVFSVWKSGLNL
jgi:hypothetical protein